MSGPAQLLAPDGGETLYAGVPAEVTWSGSTPLPFQVQYTANFGETTTELDDFERTTLGADYTTGGDRGWLISPGTAHSGTRSARAGSITHNQISTMTRDVDAGPISFWYRVSSESNYDWFNFYIDGQQFLHRSGNTSWTYFSHTLGPGQHTLKWEYTKDVSLSGGSDTAWVDELEVTENNTVWTDIVAETDPGATSAMWTPPAPGTDYKVRVRTIYGPGSYGAWDESTSTFSVEELTIPPGDFDLDGDVDLIDFATFSVCFGGPNQTTPPPGCSAQEFAATDLDDDGDVDLSDFSTFSTNFGT
jgi:hypothetical protein